MGGSDIPTMAMGRLLMSSWKMNAAQHRPDSASEQAKSLAWGSITTNSNLTRDVKTGTSPDEGHKDTEGTVSGLCNPEPTLQKA